jgi:hypothetical protein
MNLFWPDEYQEKIETVIGAKFDWTGQAPFLSSETITSVSDAKGEIERIRFIEKQLRHVKKELGNKIRDIKSQRKPGMRKKGILGFAAAISDNNINKKTNSYQLIAHKIDEMLELSFKRRINIEIWIGQQRSKLKDQSITRQPLSEEVQLYVWNRDGGKCVKCGSQFNLEYDHIIPVSKGGSNTARNIQLLCEPCNRKKSKNLV